MDSGTIVGYGQYSHLGLGGYWCMVGVNGRVDEFGCSAGFKVCSSQYSQHTDAHVSPGIDTSPPRHFPLAKVICRRHYPAFIHLMMSWLEEDLSRT